MSLYIQETKNGKGVFTNTAIKSGEIISPFEGKVIHSKDLPQMSVLKPEDDRYAQVGDDLYMGPSGGFDDLFNHSCDPNSGLKFYSDRIVLVAIRDIHKDEEITWDYSTTMKDDDWTMQCNCGASRCRGIVKEFKFLPKEIQLEYIKLGIVPDYISKRFSDNLN